MSVYVLELEGCNFYVGYSDDVPRRLAEHWLGRGSMWTRTHPPVRVLDVVPGGKDLENATTFALMSKHGWRHVRGGAWRSIELRSMPIPLARALAGRPPREVQVAGTSIDHHDHLIHTEGPPWIARVSGLRRSGLARGFAYSQVRPRRRHVRLPDNWLIKAGLLSVCDWSCEICFGQP